MTGKTSTEGPPPPPLSSLLWLAEDEVNALVRRLHQRAEGGHEGARIDGSLEGGTDAHARMSLGVEFQVEGEAAATVLADLQVGRWGCQGEGRFGMQGRLRRQQGRQWNDGWRWRTAG